MGQFVKIIFFINFNAFWELLWYNLCSCTGTNLLEENHFAHKDKSRMVTKRERNALIMKIGFDHQKYLALQSKRIRERIGQFGNKLYLEFGGKLFDDYHASRVLPGFEPDSKLKIDRKSVV